MKKKNILTRRTFKTVFYNRCKLILVVIFFVSVVGLCACAESSLDSANIEISKPEIEKITIEGGLLGTHGKSITMDGYTSINYYVPYGKYQLTNQGNWSKMYIAKDEYFKNTDGYMENEIVEIIDLTTFEETITFEINDGEHLEFTSNAFVILEQLK